MIIQINTSLRVLPICEDVDLSSLALHRQVVRELALEALCALPMAEVLTDHALWVNACMTAKWLHACLSRRVQSSGSSHNSSTNIPPRLLFFRSHG